MISHLKTLFFYLERQTEEKTNKTNLMNESFELLSANYHNFIINFFFSLGNKRKIII